MSRSYPGLSLCPRSSPHWPRPSVCLRPWWWGETAEVSSLLSVTVAYSNGTRQQGSAASEEWRRQRGHLTTRWRLHLKPNGQTGGRGLMLCCWHTSSFWAHWCFLGLFAWAWLWNMQSHWCMFGALKFGDDKMLPTVLPLEGSVSLNVAEVLKAAGAW